MKPIVITMLAFTLSSCVTQEKKPDSTYFTESRNAAYGYAYTIKTVIGNSTIRCSETQSKDAILEAKQRWKSVNDKYMYSADKYLDHYILNAVQVNGKRKARAMYSALQSQLVKDGLSAVSDIFSKDKDRESVCSKFSESVQAGEMDLVNHTEFGEIFLQMHQKYMSEHSK